MEQENERPMLLSRLLQTRYQKHDTRLRLTARRSVIWPQQALSSSERKKRERTRNQRGRNRRHRSFLWHIPRTRLKPMMAPRRLAAARLRFLSTGGLARHQSGCISGSLAHGEYA